MVKNDGKLMPQTICTKIQEMVSYLGLAVTTVAVKIVSSTELDKYWIVKHFRVIEKKMKYLELF